MELLNLFEEDPEVKVIVIVNEASGTREKGLRPLLNGFKLFLETGIALDSQPPEDISILKENLMVISGPRFPLLNGASFGFEHFR